MTTTESSCNKVIGNKSPWVMCVSVLEINSDAFFLLALLHKSGVGRLKIAVFVDISN